MKLLLDSHVLVWWLAGDKRVGAARRAAIQDPGALACFSPVSVWELGLKRLSGKLDLGARDLVEAFVAAGFTELPLTAAHAQRALGLPPVHRDPIDRFLVAQALEEQMTLVSDDAAIRGYPVPLL